MLSAAQRRTAVEVLTRWVDDYGYETNALLRAGGDVPLAASYAGDVRLLRELIDEQGPLPVGTMLYRGVEVTPAQLGGIRDAIGSARLLDRGFASTSRSMNAAEGFPSRTWAEHLAHVRSDPDVRHVTLAMKAGKGIPGVDVAAVVGGARSYAADEAEILLAPAVRFVPDGVQGADGGPGVVVSGRLMKPGGRPIPSLFGPVAARP